MSELKLPEVWLRGPLPGISSYLQPIAHALLQAKDEVNKMMEDFPDKLLWEQPAGLASPAFHLQHFSGVLSRLFTYARGQSLSSEQLQALKEEGVKQEALTTNFLLERFNQQIEHAIEQLKTTDEKTLNDFRGVGRAQLPSTVLGLLAHSAEHTMRHVGQLLVTVRILKSAAKS
ncbi:MAG TPA: DinB family protein [Chitinophagaceae bacterium]|nr:DinB family protein [Chitinophagaceae bacterium]